MILPAILGVVAVGALAVLASKKTPVAPPEAPRPGPGPGPIGPAPRVDSSPWTPPPPPPPGGTVASIDPRVVKDHPPGTPCPSNPPAPVGWTYWSGTLPKGGAELAVQMRDDRENHPLGSFVQTWLDGQLVGSRCEWHPFTAGKKGCFRGINLMRPVKK